MPNIQQPPVSMVMVTFNTGLFITLAGLLCYVLQQLHSRSPKSQVTESARESSLSVVCSKGPMFMCLYMFFSVAHKFAQHEAGDVHLDPVVPALLIYVLKLTLALGMYRASDGTFTELRKGLEGNRSALLTYAVPSACLGFYDMISFISLAKFSPAQYQVLLHLRTVLMAFFWQFAMSKRLSLSEWGALLAIVYAAFSQASPLQREVRVAVACTKQCLFSVRYSSIWSKCVNIRLF